MAFLPEDVRLAVHMCCYRLFGVGTGNSKRGGDSMMSASVKVASPASLNTSFGGYSAVNSGSPRYFSAADTMMTNFFHLFDTCAVQLTDTINNLLHL